MTPGSSNAQTHGPVLMGRLRTDLSMGSTPAHTSPWCLPLGSDGAFLAKPLSPPACVWHGAAPYVSSSVLGAFAGQTLELCLATRGRVGSVHGVRSRGPQEEGSHVGGESFTVRPTSSRIWNLEMSWTWRSWGCSGCFDH